MTRLWHDLFLRFTLFYLRDGTQRRSDQIRYTGHIITPEFLIAPYVLLLSIGWAGMYRVTKTKKNNIVFYMKKKKMGQKKGRTKSREPVA